MASLIENLIMTLEQESELYELLTKESMDKTAVIVANDLERLSQANEREQRIVDDITSVSHKRNLALQEIATVLGKDANTITVSEVIQLMGHLYLFVTTTFLIYVTEFALSKLC